MKTKVIPNPAAARFRASVLAGTFKIELDLARDLKAGNPVDVDSAAADLLAKAGIVTVDKKNESAAPAKTIDKNGGSE